MSRYILKYGRDGRVKFISHLDFVRCFHRAVRRSRLNFEFSQGFNPHPIMTVAQPMPVGVTGEGEYMKVGLVTDMSDGEITAELNRCLPPGFTVYKTKRVEGKEIDLTKIDRAEYYVETECPERGDIRMLTRRTELIVPKKTKSGIKESDILPHIFEIEDLGYENGIQTLRMVLSCGSVYNLRPESVIAAMEKYCDGFKPGFIAAHRKRMMIGENEVM